MYIFNKNNIKVSYSCMDNMTIIINSHSKYVASKKVQANQNLCNCRNSDNCPLDSKCLTSKIVYSAEIITNSQQPSKFYLGICETEFKTRFNNHKKSFSHRQNEKDTELSKYIWELKDKHTEYRLDVPLPQNQVAITLQRSLAIFVYRRNYCYVILVTRAN